MTYNLYENDGTDTNVEIKADSLESALQKAINGVRRVDYDIDDEDKDDLLVDVLVIAADDRTVFAGADVTVTPERCRIWRALSDNEINARYWHLVGAK